MKQMTSIVPCLVFVATLAGGAACSKKSGSPCEEVVDHTISIMPAELKAKVEGDKAKAIEKCEKMSPEARTCALDAKSIEDLMKCPRQ